MVAAWLHHRRACRSRSSCVPLTSLKGRSMRCRLRLAWRARPAPSWCSCTRVHYGRFTRVGGRTGVGAAWGRWAGPGLAG
jgi:hypothetical protein